jgi:hypothetical protein
MKIKNVEFLLIGLGALAIISCNNPLVSQKQTQIMPELTAVSEEAEITVSDSAPSAASRWPGSAHISVASIAAAQWGLSADRVAIIAEHSDDPDVYQAGLDNGYNQQWSHAYIYDRWFSSSFYLWGDADDDFKENLDGPLGGEGYDGKYAGYWYQNGDRASGDMWLGIAIHFIEDVSITLHSTAPTSSGITVPMKTTDMLTKHFAFEDWVNANLTSGHCLLDAVAADTLYYPVTDPRTSLKNAAWASCAYKGTSSVGNLAWKAYRDSGYPTGPGTGSAVLVENTKKMLIAAGRYAKGTIKYTLDKYVGW